MMNVHNFRTGPITVNRLAERRDTDLILAAVARAEWAKQPELTAEYQAETDRLFVRIGVQYTVASLITAEDGLFVGFDNDSRGAWPTLVSIAGARQAVDNESDMLATAVALLGDSFLVAAYQALENPGARLRVPLDSKVGDALRAVWDELDILPAATTAEELTDELLESTITSWSVELLVSSSHRAIENRVVSKDPANTEPSARFATAISNDTLFQSLVGRPRRRTEPFPVAEVNIDVRSADVQISIVIVLPRDADTGGIVSADVTIANQTWNMIMDREQSQPDKLFGARLLPNEALHLVSEPGALLKDLQVGLAIHVSG